MKKVGIITMHRVINYGSALQAYALQQIVRNLGYDCEIIDYIYPNGYHLSLFPKIPIWKSVIRFIIQLAYGFPRKIRIKLFNSFYTDFLKLSSTRYETQEQLQKNPPYYDIYITGSDQVWNPKYVGEDTSFMLSFVTRAPKIAYSPSFATGSIPDKYKTLYGKYINKYQAISVREEKGCQIVKDITGKKASIVLDPTLLLRAECYEPIIEKGSIHINGPYILAYILDYSFDFNPYPFIERLIIHIQQKIGYKVCLLGVSERRMLFIPGTTRLQKVGPAEFLYLFKNASYVITSSFHGTAFSLIYNKPFYSIMDRNSTDNRILNLLRLLKLENHAIYIGDDMPTNISTIKDGIPYDNALMRFKERSIHFLQDALWNN